MKIQLVCLIVAALSASANADVPDAATLGQSTMVEKFDWAQVDQRHEVGGVNVAWNWWPTGAEAAVFAGNSGTKSVDLNLCTLGPAICSKITTTRYAIASMLGYESVPEGSYLEMLSTYAPTGGGKEITLPSRTTADSGPAAKIEGTENNRTLLLPFDSTNVKGDLVRIKLNLHLAGHGFVHLGQTWLVEYPDLSRTMKPWTGAMRDNNGASPACKVASASAAGVWRLDWISCLVGAVAAMAMVTLGWATLAFKQRFKCRAHEKELRRMASIDS